MMETTKATIEPVNKIMISSDPNVFPLAKNLKIFKKLAPNITGIPKKNENSVATKREAPIKIAPKMVAPGREVPGINASTWKAPTIKAAL